MVIPTLLDVSATLESVCPVTGNPIRFRIDGDSMERMVETEPALSFRLLDPSRRFVSCDQEILEFCNHVNLFATSQAGRTWISTRPGTFLMTPADGFTLAKRYTESHYGLARKDDGPPSQGNRRGEVA